MILVFAEHITERLQFTLSFLLKDKGIAFDLTNNVSEFKNFKGPRLNYSVREFEGNLFQIKPHPLLFESHIRDAIEIGYNVDLKKAHIEGFHDVLALTFFTLSRYEEYWDYARDEHQRFPAKESILYQQNVLDEPIVDYWNQQLVGELNGILGTTFKIESRFKCIPTFDIDSTWAFLNKGFLRTGLSMLVDLVKGKEAKENRILRKKVFSGEEKDPFDQYEFINAISEDFDFTPLYFWLLGDSSTYDRNLYWKNKKQAEKINECHHYADIGIHPSYMSNHDPAQLKREIDRLATILDRNIRKSRQHFLKLDIPNTYNNLVDVGIKEDYSLGFADHYGFRAGTSYPFDFFNLETNEVKSLRIYSITYMDGTLNQYMNLSVEESKQVISGLIRKVNQVKGHFIPLWHNETIGEKGIWKDWKQVLEFTLNECNEVVKNS